MATTYFNDSDINTAFKLAGFVRGRPSEDNISDAVHPYRPDLLLELFDDDYLELISIDAHKSVYLLAGLIVKACMQADLTTQGRPIWITSTSMGEYSENYSDPEDTRIAMLNKIKELNRHARSHNLSLTHLDDPIIGS